MAWTDERIKQLRQLWSEGQSASKIAEKLGGVKSNIINKFISEKVVSGSDVLNNEHPVKRIMTELRTGKEIMICFCSCFRHF